MKHLPRFMLCLIVILTTVSAQTWKLRWSPSYIAGTTTPGAGVFYKLCEVRSDGGLSALLTTKDTQATVTAPPNKSFSVVAFNELGEAAPSPTWRTPVEYTLYLQESSNLSSFTSVASVIAVSAYEGQDFELSVETVNGKAIVHIWQKNETDGSIQELAAVIRKKSSRMFYRLEKTYDTK